MRGTKTAVLSSTAVPARGGLRGLLEHLFQLALFEGQGVVGRDIVSLRRVRILPGLRRTRLIRMWRAL
jgi:hypothetical protein